MGRPKQHPDEAAKHRTYRARLAATTLRVDRRAWEALEGRANRLNEAVAHARAAGCPVAAQIRSAHTDTVLELLAVWFEEQAAAQHRARRSESGKT